MRWGRFVVALATIACTGRTPMRLDPALYYDAGRHAVQMFGDTLSYMIRAEHPDHLWLAVGDTLDAVLLRLRCQDNWCRSRPGDVATEWSLEGPAVTALSPVSNPRWWIGHAAAEVRLVGRAPGWAWLVARFPDATLRELVFVAPQTARLRVEPKAVTVRAGDTAWIRIAALDAGGHAVAYLPHFWGGPRLRPPRDGRVPLVLEPGSVGGPRSYVVRLGRRRADTLFVQVVPP
jgi:hypothetical protein